MNRERILDTREINDAGAQTEIPLFNLQINLQKRTDHVTLRILELLESF